MVKWGRVGSFLRGESFRGSGSGDDGDNGVDADEALEHPDSAPEHNWDEEQKAALERYESIRHTLDAAPGPAMPSDAINEHLTVDQLEAVRNQPSMRKFSAFAVVAKLHQGAVSAKKEVRVFKRMAKQIRAHRDAARNAYNKVQVPPRYHVRRTLEAHKPVLDPVTWKAKVDHLSEAERDAARLDRQRRYEEQQSRNQALMEQQVLDVLADDMDDCKMRPFSAGSLGLGLAPHDIDVARQYPFDMNHWSVVLADEHARAVQNQRRADIADGLQTSSPHLVQSDSLEGMHENAPAVAVDSKIQSGGDVYSFENLPPQQQQLVRQSQGQGQAQAPPASEGDGAAPTLRLRVRGERRNSVNSISTVDFQGAERRESTMQAARNRGKPSRRRSSIAVAVGAATREEAGRRSSSVGDAQSQIQAQKEQLALLGGAGKRPATEGGRGLGRAQSMPDDAGPRFVQLRRGSVCPADMCRERREQEMIRKSIRQSGAVSHEVSRRRSQAKALRRRQRGELALDPGTVAVARFIDEASGHGPRKGSGGGSGGGGGASDEDDDDKVRLLTREDLEVKHKRAEYMIHDSRQWHRNQLHNEQRREARRAAREWKAKQELAERQAREQKMRREQAATTRRRIRKQESKRRMEAVVAAGA